MHNFLYIVYKYNFRWSLVLLNDACDLYALFYITQCDDSDKNVLSFYARDRHWRIILINENDETLSKKNLISSKLIRYLLQYIIMIMNKEMNFIGKSRK